ncbi:DUF1439 domain-containing protein [Alteromonas lipotrueiana]|uniref:DUF1439 domain-containing protein n=1 Tax=Alteromonas lipotrueiana TaxID=2803815 RepID=UPI001C4808B0|nr:DUF1439 domain-containing protein [Alteromonas lipotrueiana]
MNTLCYKYIVFVILAVLSVSANALDLKLSQQDLNQMVTLAFPQRSQYQSIDMIFSDPVVRLDHQNVVNVTLTISGQNQAQKAKVRASMQGELRYQKSAGTLNIHRPELTDLTILEQPKGDHSELIDTLQSLKNQPAPLILLIDFAQLNLPLLGNRTPTNIKVENRQLVVSF